MDESKWIAISAVGQDMYMVMWAEHPILWGLGRSRFSTVRVKRFDDLDEC